MNFNFMCLGVDLTPDMQKAQDIILKDFSQAYVGEFQFVDYGSEKDFMEGLSKAVENDDIIVLTVQAELYMAFKRFIAAQFKFKVKPQKTIQRLIVGTYPELEKEKMLEQAAMPVKADVMISEDGLYSGYAIRTDTQIMFVLPLDPTRLDFLLEDGVFPYLRDNLDVSSVQDGDSLEGVTPLGKKKKKKQKKAKKKAWNGVPQRNDADQKKAEKAQEAAEAKLAKEPTEPLDVAAIRAAAAASAGAVGAGAAAVEAGEATGTAGTVETGEFAEAMDPAEGEKPSETAEAEQAEESVKTTGSAEADNGTETNQLSRVAKSTKSSRAAENNAPALGDFGVEYNKNYIQGVVDTLRLHETTVAVADTKTVDFIKRMATDGVDYNGVISFSNYSAERKKKDAAEYVANLSRGAFKKSHATLGAAITKVYSKTGEDGTREYNIYVSVSDGKTADEAKVTGEKGETPPQLIYRAVEVLFHMMALWDERANPEPEDVEVAGAAESEPQIPQPMTPEEIKAKAAVANKADEEDAEPTAKSLSEQTDVRANENPQTADGQSASESVNKTATNAEDTEAKAAEETAAKAEAEAKAAEEAAAKAEAEAEARRQARAAAKAKKAKLKAEAANKPKGPAETPKAAPKNRYPKRMSKAERKAAQEKAEREAAKQAWKPKDNKS